MQAFDNELILVPITYQTDYQTFEVELDVIVEVVQAAVCSSSMGRT